MIGTIPLRGGPYHGWTAPVSFEAGASPSYVVVQMTADGPIRSDYLLVTEGGVYFYSYVQPPEICP